MAGYLSKLRTTHQKELNLLCVSLKLNSKKHQNKPQKKMKERKSEVEKRQVTFDWNPVYYRAKKGAQGHRGHSTRYCVFHPLWPRPWCSQGVGRAWSFFFRVQRPKDMTQETGNGYVLEKSSCVEVDESVS